MKRRVLWLSGALLLVGLATWFGAWAMMPVPAAVQAYERLRVGMTLDDAEAAVGRPAGYYGITNTRFGVGMLMRQTGFRSTDFNEPANRRRLGVTVEAWEWDDYCVWVYLDKEGRVILFELIDVRDRQQPPPPTGLDRLRTLLHL